VGRAYLIYGSPNLVRTTKTIDVDNPTSFTGLNVVTFVNTLGNAQTGTSVAAAGTVLSAQTNSVAIGAPGASLNGQAQNGAVYIVSGETGGALRPASTRVVNLAFLGQGGTTNIPGVILSGANSGDAAGYSLADAGNVDATPGDELLIGAIQANIDTLTATGPGVAYLIYGGNLASFAVVLNGVNQITLSRIGSTATNGVPGASFAGAAVGDLTGYAVSPAGDFNADGLADFLIGSPGFTSAAGRASLIFGRAATPNPPGRINGSFQLSSLPVGVPFVEFDGPLPGTLAGWAVTAVLDLNGDLINEIAIGAPGFNAGQGVVYLIPGNPDLAGVQNLANNEGPAIQGLNINLSSPQGAHFLGSSVSGRLAVNSSGRTVDGDNLGDLIVGAAGYSLNTARTQAGTGFALEGAFLAPFLPPPVSNAITSDIGVNSVFPPFTVSVSAPVDLPLFILSGGSNTPGFTPPTDLNPNTIRVNGVPLPDPGTFENAGDLDGDGIDDASFIFSPISLLGLTPGNVTFIIQAQTSASGQFPNRRYTGTALVRVTGVPPEPPPSVPITQDAFLDDPNAARPPFGERFLPQAFVLSRFRWRALLSETAYRQFRPNRFFGSRLRFASHPNKAPKETKYNSLTLKNDVFSRGRFKPGLAAGRFRHKQAVIPLQNI
jgi:hypothetical protein